MKQVSRITEMTPDERSRFEELMRTHYPDHGPAEMIRVVEEQMGISPTRQLIKSRAGVMELRMNPDARARQIAHVNKTANTGRSKLDAHADFLKEHLGRMPLTEIARAIQSSPSSVRRWAVANGYPTASTPRTISRQLQIEYPPRDSRAAYHMGDQLEPEHQRLLDDYLEKWLPSHGSGGVQNYLYRDYGIWIERKKIAIRSGYLGLKCNNSEKETEAMQARWSSLPKGEKAASAKPKRSKKRKTPPVYTHDHCSWMALCCDRRANHDTENYHPR